MRALVAFAAASATALVASAALPCGVPFGAGVNVDPRQDILVSHKGGVETYVFQPAVCGAPADFGFILPVPSMLTSAPALASKEAFAAADALSKPLVVPKTECRRFGGLDAGAAPPGRGGTDGARVVTSGSVGFLDWAQLEARDEASFTSWLDANGYPYDARARAAFAYYVGKKWYFVAFKVSQAGLPPRPTGECTALGPIKLAFRTDAPVVPSRMAGSGAARPDLPPMYRGFSWRIFAVTDPAAQVAFAGGEDASHKLGFAGAIPDGDVTKLDGLAAKGDRLTKLTLWFDGNVMEDVALTRAAASDFRETLYDVTYVDCASADAGPDAAPALTDAGQRPSPADASPSAPLTPGDDVVEDRGGCSASGVGGGSLGGVALALAALLTRRRRR